jgi:hypothetical protein
MTLKNRNNGQILVVLSSPNWMWLVLSGLILAGFSGYLYLDIAAYTFDASENQDIAVIGAVIFFLLIFFVLAFIRPHRENRLDLIRHKLSRDICTVLGNIRIDVRLAEADEALVYHMDDGGQNYGIQIFMQKGNKFPIAVDLSYLEAEMLQDKINALILTMRYPDRAKTSAWRDKTLVRR